MLSCKSQFLRIGAGVAAAALLALTGCGQFFPPLGSGGGGGGGGGTSSGNYLYVGNLGTNPPSIAGFTIGTSSVSAISGSNWAVSLEPTALAVTPDDSLLFVGSAAGGIYVYSIGSNGAITLGNNGGPVATGVSPSVLRVDSTGKWLLGASAFAGQAYVYAIGSGGSLTAISSSVVTLNSNDPATDLEIAPNDSLVFVSCGIGGIYEMSFNNGTGALTQINGVLNPKVTNAADNGLAVAPSGNFLFAAETVTGGVRVFSIGTNGVLKEASGSPYSTNTGAWDVLVDSTGSYVYVANRTVGTISAFLLTNTGALTAVSGSPFTTGSLPVALVEDKTNAYIAVINSGGSSDLQVFTISTTTPGALTSFATAKTGSDPTQASSIAATH
ncbi:MAG: lactonase family protein [Acidobacteriota bacterium]